MPTATPTSGQTTTPGSTYGTYGNTYTPGQTPLPNLGTTTYSNPSSPTSSAGNFGNLLTGLGSNINNILGSDIGQLGTYAGLYALISGQAGAAENENNALAGQISAIGQPAVNESQNLLGAYSGGQLTGPFQTQLNTALTGIQQAATSESQQSGQLLANAGGQNVTSTMASQQGQINTVQQQQNQAAVANAFAGELSSSNSLLAAGGPYVQQGVAQEINSNTQLQAQLSSLMAGLASAYAQGTGGSKAATPSSGSGKSSGGGGGGGGGSGAGSYGQTLANINNPNYVANELTNAINASGLEPFNLDANLNADSADTNLDADISDSGAFNEPQGNYSQPNTNFPGEYGNYTGGY